MNSDLDAAAKARINFDRARNRDLSLTVRGHRLASPRSESRSRCSYQQRTVCIP
jgi:hypothetical protein